MNLTDIKQIHSDITSNVKAVASLVVESLVVESLGDEWTEIELK